LMQTHRHTNYFFSYDPPYSRGKNVIKKIEIDINLNRILFENKIYCVC